MQAPRNPEIPDHYRDAEYLFLANIDPELQLKVLNQVNQPKLVACDTMNFWIENKLDALKETIKRIDILVINEAETRELAKESNLVKACRAILAMGPKTLIIKQGNYGALMFTENSIFSAPAYPLEETVDPTGAGDTFAGALTGWVSRQRRMSNRLMAEACVVGTAMASLTCEGFGVSGLLRSSIGRLLDRCHSLRRMSMLPPVKMRT